jgi:parallel beta-helix repeat protein
VDGLVLHRDVSNSNVESTIARNNAQNGFRLARATSSVTFQRLQAIDNGRDGISLEGGPLADGPSATGIPTTVYGNNEVTGSTSTGNARYGIEVVGGTNIVIAGNTVSHNVMGIVVSKAATGISIKSNEVTDSQKQGIAIKDSALDASVVDNKVSNTSIGIYARDAGGNFEGNTITGVSNHGISLLHDREQQDLGHRAEPDRCGPHDEFRRARQRCQLVAGHQAAAGGPAEHPAAADDPVDPDRPRRHRVAPVRATSCDDP